MMNPIEKAIAARSVLPVSVRTISSANSPMATSAPPTTPVARSESRLRWSRKTPSSTVRWNVWVSWSSSETLDIACSFSRTCLADPPYTALRPAPRPFCHDDRRAPGPQHDRRVSTAAPRRNRVDPFGDLHAVPERGRFTGNRGVLVDGERRLVHHHRGNLWITCVTSYGDRRHGLDDPGTWTPLFFLDDAVALAAGHRPCGECRPQAYRAYRAGVTAGLGRSKPVGAAELNRLLARERLRRGQGLARAGDRILWESPLEDLPDGTVVAEPGEPARLVLGHRT